LQSLAWYWRRLRSMPPAEVGWRVRNVLRQGVDLCVLPLRSRPLPLERIAARNGSTPWRRSGLLNEVLLGVADERIETILSAAERAALVSRADAICRNRLRLFDVAACDLGPEVDFNCEYIAGLPTPRCFADHIDYRDYAAVGDARIAWEPARHQHLVVLGRAYRVTGERRYAEKVVEQVESWIRQCPYGMGMQWRSPLELAIRLINWVWAFELIKPSGLLTSAWGKLVLPVVHRHLWEIARKYSRHSSANNHLIGEAAGVWIGSNYFHTLKGVSRWARESREILIAESARQIHADGGHREQAFGYHLFVLEFLLLCGWVARRRDWDFPATYWDNVTRMLSFAEAMLDGGDAAPMFGDCDDGYVLDLNSPAERAHTLVALGAAVCPREEPPPAVLSGQEAIYWLTGPAPCVAGGAGAAAGAPTAVEPRPLQSRAFPDSGCYLLQTGHRRSADRVSVVFDCGPLGFGPIAAHGHADALSVALRVSGIEVLIDPGTYDYFTWRPWRDYFRSTRAHNAVVVDDENQSEMLGLFLWGRRAEARCTLWEPTADGGRVTGEHNGYARLPDPVSHRRSVMLRGSEAYLLIEDELEAGGAHAATLCLHFAEHCRVAAVTGGAYTVAWPGGEGVLEVDPSLEVRLLIGSEDPIAGWVSRGYHDRRPATTLVGRRQWSGNLRLRTCMRWAQLSV